MNSILPICGCHDVVDVAPPARAQSFAELRAAFYQDFQQEFNPTGFAESLLVRELARIAAQSAVAERLADETERQAKELAATLESVSGASDLTTQLLAPPRLESMNRTALRNSNSFFLRLGQLREEQRRRGQSAAIDLGRDARFTTEVQCLSWLVHAFRSGRRTCLRCGVGGHGSWIPTRKCWECTLCHAQTGIRHGTAFSHSKLPLTTWFHAVRVLLLFPTASSETIGAAIGIERRQTVRSIAKRLTAALTADNASELLADLDAAYLSFT
jgi:hypothetical protein